MNKNDINELSSELEGELYIDELNRYLAATDGSIYEVMPLAVAYPKNRADVVRLVRFAGEKSISLHPRGAGSGLCGSALGPGIVVDFSRYMNRIISIDPDNRIFTCEPGLRGGELEKKASAFNLFFPPAPSSFEYASFGGMYSTNASGAHSVKYGNVSDYIEDAEVITGDGEVINLAHHEGEASLKIKKLISLYRENKDLIENGYPDVSNNVCGYNLKEMVFKEDLFLGRLFSGAEGSLGIVTRLKFRLERKPRHETLVIAFFSNIASAGEAVLRCLPLKPAGIEIMDSSLLNLARKHDPLLRKKIPEKTGNLLLIEFNGFHEDVCANQAASAREAICRAKLAEDVRTAVSEEQKKRFWELRKAAVPILYRLKSRKKILALVEDAAIPVQRLPDYFDGAARIFHRHSAEYVMFGHIAKGLIHTRPLLDLKDPADIKLLRPIADDFFELVLSLGGTVSGEHGDGRLRSAYVPRQYPGLYPVMRQVKEILDGKKIFNPEIIIDTDPDLVEKNLRFGLDYTAFDSDTALLFGERGFIEEAEKCHGCSKCTTVTGATRMCPAYKATRNPANSPKAKANILRGILSGRIAEEIAGKRIKDLTEACMMCGSCRIECPSGVDIPRLVAEVRARHVKRYGHGFADLILSEMETPAKAGRLVNVLSGLSPLKRIARPWTRVAVERRLPRFSGKPFLQYKSSIKKGEKVLYFAGCHSRYIKPKTGMDTVFLLEKCGFEVIMPGQSCCGLPFYAKGMLKHAKEKIRKNLATWGELARDVGRVVTGCTSCGYMLEMIWPGLNEEGRKRRWLVTDALSLIAEAGKGLEFAEKKEKVAYHLPCHQKGRKGQEAAGDLLVRIPGVELEILDDRCCGMAGSWGYYRENLELSLAIGNSLTERIDLLSIDRLVTNCPTCKIQIEELTGGTVLHPVELLAERLV